MIWLLSCILIPFVTAIVCIFFRRHPSLVRVIGVSGSVILLLASIMLTAEVNSAGYVVVQPGGWSAPFGITLRADLLSATMVLIT